MNEGQANITEYRQVNWVEYKVRKKVQKDYKGFPGCAGGKEPWCQCRRYETQVSSLGWEAPLEEGMATYASILAWEIPWTEESGGLYSHRVAKSQT